MVAHDVAIRRRGIDAHLAELGAELEPATAEAEGRALRVAFTGGRLGPFDGLAGGGRRDAGGLKIRAARAGLTVVAALDGDELRGELTLDHLPLAPLSRHDLDLGGARATGRVRFDGDADEVEARGQVTLDEAAIRHAAVAGGRIGPMSIQLDGVVGISADRIRTEDLSVSIGSA